MGYKSMTCGGEQCWETMACVVTEGEERREGYWDQRTELCQKGVESTHLLAKHVISLGQLYKKRLKGKWHNVTRDCMLWPGTHVRDHYTSLWVLDIHPPLVTNALIWNQLITFYLIISVPWTTLKHAGVLIVQRGVVVGCSIFLITKKAIAYILTNSRDHYIERKNKSNK